MSQATGKIVALEGRTARVSITRPDSDGSGDCSNCALSRTCGSKSCTVSIAVPAGEHLAVGDTVSVATIVGAGLAGYVLLFGLPLAALLATLWCLTASGMSDAVAGCAALAAAFAVYLPLRKALRFRPVWRYIAKIKNNEQWIQ